MSEPLVTINILSYNRRDELRNTLQKVFEQEYKNIEVILVDNASSDGTVAMVKENYPAVRIIPLEENIGIAGWNEGFKDARGEYILVLDDNAYPKADAIARGVKVFQEDREKTTACIAFNIFDLRTKKFWDSVWLPANRDERSYCPVFVGCAFMLDAKKLTLDRIMPAHYFLYQNELSISARIHNQGYRIQYVPEIVGYHWFFEHAEYSIRRDMLVFQNNLFFVMEFLPMLLSAFYAVQCMLYFGIRAVRRKWIKEYFVTVKKVFLNHEPHQPVRLSYFFELRRLHIFNFTLRSKVNNLKRRMQS